MRGRWYGKFGNSRASFLSSSEEERHFEIENSKEIKKFLRLKVRELIYISVIDLPPHFFSQETRSKRVTRRDIPLGSMYHGAVGVDRLINSYSAGFLGSSKHRVVLDCGTATCVDFASDNLYRGGWISVGAETGLRALHENTARLPRLKPKKIKMKLGRTTYESLQIGIRESLLGQALEAEKIARKIFGRSKVDFILSGGWAHLIADQVEWRHEPLLGLLGLKKVDEYRKTRQ
jgi:pantothenate kinase type III